MKRLLFTICLITTCYFCINYFIDRNTASFKVMSYNILADKFCKYGDYSQVAEEDLKWANRKHNLIEYILNIKADVICLQEVDVAAYDFISQKLAHYGYAAIYGDSLDTKNNDAVMTLYKNSKFKLAKTKIIAFPNSSKTFLISELLETTNKKISIVNVKIKWDDSNKKLKDHIGYKQINFLISNLLPLIESGPLLICGDFNVEPDGMCLHKINEFLDDIHANTDYKTFNENRYLKRIDYIFYNKFVKHNNYSQYIKLTPDTVLPSKNQPSDHLPVVATIDFII